MLFGGDITRQIVVTLIPKSEEQRDAWFNAMELAMESVTPIENYKQGHVLQLTTFDEPTYCFQCQRILKGKFFQGYRCLRCLANLHKSCLADYVCLERNTFKNSC